jgi:hypothetical protein
MHRVRRPLSLLVAVVCATLAFPAAAQAVYRTFQTPSGQIMCAYFNDFGGALQIRCDLLFLNDRAAVVRPSGKGRIVKVTDAAGNPRSRRLAYGTSTRFGIYTCTSRRTGLTCKSRRTGHGFTVSRQSQRVF